MRKLFVVYLPVLLFLLLMSCSSGKQVKTVELPGENKPSEEKGTEEIIPDNKSKEYNFKFIGYDINIDDPALDRRTYYKIYINKIDAGRTTIGLESQKKTFELKIPSNRHLLMVEKWVLDEKKGQYVKLNNIEQPKPGYTYFELPDGKVAVIVLKNDPSTNKAEFKVEFE